MTNSTEYSQGICGDGAAILKNGQMLTIEEIVSELRQCADERDALKAEAEDLKHDIGRYIQQASALAEEVERLESGGADYYAISNDDQHLAYDVRTGQLEVFEDMESAELKLKSLKSYKLLRVRVSARRNQTTEDQAQ